MYLAKDLIFKIKRYINIGREIYRLPRVVCNFSKRSCANCRDVLDTYRNFNGRHSKYLIIRKKTVGVALVDFRKFQNYPEYIESISGKNSAAYYARKAASRGYIFREIDKNKYVDDIYAINTSARIRQGRAMGGKYLIRTEKYEQIPNFSHYGVLSPDGTLVAYCDVGVYGDFAVLSTLLGHHEYLNAGIMYFMVVSAVERLMNVKPLNFLMYDTYFGASDGLKNFKIKLGFAPYIVKWKKDWK